MGIFDELNTNAQVFENSKYFQPGRYIIAVQGCKFIEGGHKGDTFVVECMVHGAKPDTAGIAAFAAANPDKAVLIPPVVGETAAQVWNASGDKRDIARNTWLGFLCAAYAVTQKDYTDEQWKNISLAVIGNGALNNTLLYLEVYMKKTLKGGDFTMHRWGGVPTPEQLAEFGLQAA